MTKLSKYQLKQLTPAERIDYEDGLAQEDANTTHCYGGEVIISQEDNGEWVIVAYDSDGYEMDSRFGDTHKEVEHYLEDMVESLAEAEEAATSQ